MYIYFNNLSFFSVIRNTIYILLDESEHLSNKYNNSLQFSFVIATSTQSFNNLLFIVSNYSQRINVLYRQMHFVIVLDNKIISVHNIECAKSLILQGYRVPVKHEDNFTILVAQNNIKDTRERLMKKIAELAFVFYGLPPYVILEIVDKNKQFVKYLGHNEKIKKIIGVCKSCLELKKII